MSKFVLQPCLVRGDRISVDKTATVVTFDSKGLYHELAPSKSPMSKQVLLRLQTGAFVGLVSTRFGTGNFLLANENGKGSLVRIMKKDPTFARRIQKVYRVEEVTLDGSLHEYE